MVDDFIREFFVLPYWKLRSHNIAKAADFATTELQTHSQFCHYIQQEKQKRRTAKRFPRSPAEKIGICNSKKINIIPILGRNITPKTISVV